MIPGGYLPCSMVNIFKSKGTSRVNALSARAFLNYGALDLQPQGPL